MQSNSYKQGRRAYLKGEEITDNPFDCGERNYFEWESGWTDAADEDDHDDGDEKIWALKE